jgi:hypothetical protein
MIIPAAKKRSKFIGFPSELMTLILIHNQSDRAFDDDSIDHTTAMTVIKGIYKDMTAFSLAHSSFKEAGQRELYYRIAIGDKLNFGCLNRTMKDKRLAEYARCMTRYMYVGSNSSEDRLGPAEKALKVNSLAVLF